MEVLAGLSRTRRTQWRLLTSWTASTGGSASEKDAVIWQDRPRRGTEKVATEQDPSLCGDVARVRMFLLRYILTHARRSGSRNFEIFSTKKRKNGDSVASRNRWLEYQGKRVAQQERWLCDWQDVNYEGTMAKAPPCPERRMRTPLPQQGSSSTREEESQWSSQGRAAIASQEKLGNKVEELKWKISVCGVSH